MPAGRLAPNLVLTAATNTVAYSVPSDVHHSEVSINILNPTNMDATISLAISPNNTPNPQDYIESALVLTKDGSLIERSEMFVSPGEKIIVQSNVTGVVVRISGKEVV